MKTKVGIMVSKPNVNTKNSATVEKIWIKMLRGKGGKVGGS